MEKFPKVRFILITVVVITAINLIALGTILHSSFKKDRNGDEMFKKEATRHGMEYLKNKLELSDKQVVQFKTSGEAFFSSLGGIFDELEVQRIEMIKELKKSNPDTVALNKIADHMGELHAKIKRQVVSHMLKLRGYCTPNQIPRLDSMYNELIRTESPWRQKHRQERHQEGENRDNQNNSHK